MTTDATVSPPSPTAARRYSEQVHFLSDRQTRELLLGLAVLEAEAGGYSRPREGEVVRSLLDQAIGQLYADDPKRYRAAVKAGRRELDDRDQAGTRRRQVADALAS